MVDYTTTVNADPGMYAGLAGFFMTYFLVMLALLVVTFVALWIVFKKAGKPGWAAIVPIYNLIVLLDIAGKPAWWVVFYLLAFIPGIGGVIVLIVNLFVSLEVAKRFGKSSVFGVVGLWLFGFVGYSILAFGNAQYLGGNTPMPQQPVQPVQPVQPTQPVEPTPVDPNQPPVV